METRHLLRAKRKARVRAKIIGTASRPRLTVFRSNQAIYGQLIDDAKGVTIVSAKLAGKTVAKGKELGLTLATLAKEKKITVAVFDRDGYRYHGAVAAVADGAREGGLTL